MHKSSQLCRKLSSRQQISIDTSYFSSIIFSSIPHLCPTVGPTLISDSDQSASGFFLPPDNGLTLQHSVKIEGTWQSTKTKISQNCNKSYLNRCSYTIIWLIQQLASTQVQQSTSSESWQTGESIHYFKLKIPSKICGTRCGMYTKQVVKGVALLLHEIQSSLSAIHA